MKKFINIFDDEVRYDIHSIEDFDEILKDIDLNDDFKDIFVNAFWYGKNVKGAQMPFRNDDFVKSRSIEERKELFVKVLNNLKKIFIKAIKEDGK